jgi:hypothetical protein
VLLDVLAICATNTMRQNLVDKMHLGVRP